MKIVNAKVIVTSPNRNFVTLKIITDEGVYGIGDATLNGRELAVAAYLQEHVIPCLNGKDPLQSEDLWQFLYRGAYWRRGPVTMSAIAAVDTALWDIKAKAAGMPLYQLLGGKSRDSVMVYGHANGRDIEETTDEVARYIELGYRAIRVQTGIPGLASTYGVSTDKMFYEPADAACVGNGGANVVDELLLDELLAVPYRIEDLADGQRGDGVPANQAVTFLIFSRDSILKPCLFPVQNSSLV